MLTKRNRVFISYSHQDGEFLKRLQIHLYPFERMNLVDVWSDSKISAGDDWRKEIRRALQSASVAILLISADFLASEFIASHELPQLLEAAEKHGTRILPVIVKPCAFSRIPQLRKFQSVNNPQTSVIQMSVAEQESVWDQVAAAVIEGISQYDEDGMLPSFDVASDGESKSPFNVEDVDLLLDDQLGFFRAELSDLSLVEDYFAYEYSHIDVTQTMPYAEDVLSRHPRGSLLIEAVKTRLRNAGWEGDGILQLIWLPPFIDIGSEDTWGNYIWHVKQENNGTSWLASRVALNFERLQFQNG